MREKYYISSRPGTDEKYLIHKEDCPFLAGRDRQIFLGAFQTVKGALEKGQKFFKPAAVCRFCLKEHCTETGFRIVPWIFRKECARSSIKLNDPGHIGALLCCKN